MRHLQRLVTVLVIQSFLAHSCFVPVARAEAVDDQFTQISPKATAAALSSGEYVHGAGYGKLMMRVLLFGATAQGVHYFPEGTDLMFAVLYASGSSLGGGAGQPVAKLNGIKIRRRGQRELIEVDLEDLLEEGRSIPKLLDGDIVNIPFNWRKDSQDAMFWLTFIGSLSTFALSLATLLSVRR